MPTRAEMNRFVLERQDKFIDKMFSEIVRTVQTLNADRTRLTAQKLRSLADDVLALHVMVEQRTAMEALIADQDGCDDK